MSTEKNIFGICHIFFRQFLYIFHKTGIVTDYFIELQQCNLI